MAQDRATLFKPRRLNKTGLDKAHDLEIAFSRCLAEVVRICGTEGREVAIVATKLQEASFFAKRAMAERSEYQE